MTEFWLVRHGQTDWNLANIVQGHSDIPLNATGIAQAEALAEKLAKTSFQSIYSSDLSRALQTAQIIANRLALKVMVDPRLREIRQGSWEGQTISELLRLYPDEFRRKNDNPLVPAAEGAEPVAEVAARVVGTINELFLQYPGERVLVVSHGFSIACLYCVARGISLREAGKYIPENGDPLVLTLEKQVEIPDFVRYLEEKPI